MIGGPRNDRLEWPPEVLGGETSKFSDVAASESRYDLIKEIESFLACLPFLGGAEKIFFRDHLEDGTDVLSHSSMNENQGIGKGLPGRVRDFLLIEDLVLGHKAPAGDSVFWVVFAGKFPFDKFDSWPDAAGVLPTTAGATDPFA